MTVACYYSWTIHKYGVCILLYLLLDRAQRETLTHFKISISFVIKIICSLKVFWVICGCRGHSIFVCAALNENSYKHTQRLIEIPSLACIVYLLLKIVLPRILKVVLNIIVMVSFITRDIYQPEILSEIRGLSEIKVLNILVF